MTKVTLEDGRQVIFECPDCKHNILEEIITDVVQLTNVDIISNDDCVDYEEDSESYEDGTLERYQCQNCGFNVWDLSYTEELWEQIEQKHWYKEIK